MAVDVSVVIPTYRRTGLLKKCLMQFRKQHYPAEGFEVLVVSDGPDSSCREMIKKFNKENNGIPLIRYLELEKKKGPAAARNLGWKNANGELILFTDDDCLPLPDYISTYENAWQNHRLTLAAFTAKMSVPIKEKPTDFEKNTSLLAGEVFVTANCACTKEALKKVNGFDEQFTMAWREDSALEFALIRHNIPVIRMHNVTVVHPVRRAPWGISIREQRKTMFNVLLYKRDPELFKQKITRGPAWYYYIYLLLFVILIMACFYQHYRLMTIVFFIWLAWISWFIVKRLKGTSQSLKHVSEIVVTSFIIPFASLFWTWWGILKFKKLYV